MRIMDGSHILDPKDSNYPAEQQGWHWSRANELGLSGTWCGVLLGIVHHGVWGELLIPTEVAHTKTQVPDSQPRNLVGNMTPTALEASSVPHQ